MAVGTKRIEQLYPHRWLPSGLNETKGSRKLRSHMDMCIENLRRALLDGYLSRRLSDLGVGGCKMAAAASNPTDSWDHVSRPMIST